jgi:hypothetical protein
MKMKLGRGNSTCENYQLIQSMNGAWTFNTQPSLSTWQVLVAFFHAP